MPKAVPESSTTRRHRLAEFIEEAGTIMVRPCKTCERHGRVCKVHVRSGKCGQCLRRGQRCNLQITRSEWERLRERRRQLRDQLAAASSSTRRAREALDRANETEMRVRQELDLLEQEEAEAISVEEAGIEQQEADEISESALLAFPVETSSSGPHLGPETWNAIDGGFDLDSEFWIPDPFAPGNGGGGQSDEMRQSVPAN